jgi:hypothetical protein
MKKDFAVIFCICLCLALTLVFPRLSASYTMVNESGCRVCHDLGEFSLKGLHGVHLNCFACHDGPVQRDNVNSSACLACHPGSEPDRNADMCDLIVAHEGNPDYMPSGASCLSMGCHSEDCSDVPVTTTTPSTTTAPATTCPSETIYGEGSLEVTLLRAVRDNLLSQTPEGQELINLYYQWSPVIVRAMEDDEIFKQELKDMIDKLLPVIEKTVE